MPKGRIGYWNVLNKNNRKNPVMTISKVSRVIAIDGGEGSGKTSTAEALALKLKCARLDSGSLYRTVAYQCMLQGVPVTNVHAVVNLAEEVCPRITIRDNVTFFDDIPVGEEIRTPYVSTVTSQIAEIPEVRELLCPIQRSCINDVGLVAEGRDMTSVVFKDAILKIYLTTVDPQVRAKRRYKERLAKGEKITFEETLQKLIDRDKRDSERACCPLVRVPEAFLIESDTMSLDGVVQLIEGIWLSRLTIVDRHRAVA